MFVLLPIPVRGQLNQAPVAGFAFPQFGRAFRNGVFKFLVVIGELLVKQPDFQHVVDARFDLNQVKRLADEVFGAGFQRAQFVGRLRRQHDDGQIVVMGVALEGCHHLEPVHDRHLKVQQDQVVLVGLMQRADLFRIHRAAHAGVAGITQQLLKQLHIGCLIVHDQNTGLKNLGRHGHGNFPVLSVMILFFKVRRSRWRWRGTWVAFGSSPMVRRLPPLICAVSHIGRLICSCHG